MNILASVYACSPYDGSERAVGWNWLCEIEKHNKVWALTSKVYENDINDYKKKNPGKLKNTKFIFVEVSPKISFWHKGYRGERIYYILWQRVALSVAKKLMKKIDFDLVHHITYVTCILPTYMHKLGLPFLYGPVSGGENIPSIISYPRSTKNKIIECIRIATQKFFSMTINFKVTMKKASLILVTTEETKEIIPEKYKNKVKIFQSIGLEENNFYPKPEKKDNNICKILIAGRMIYWKGYELAIWSFIRAIENGCNAELTILGDTDDGSLEHKNYLKSLCGKYLDQNIKFVDRVEHDKMNEFYDTFDILLNCSLRDSGCFVVMEAMSRGLPIICVDTGGPRINTTESNSIKIKPDKLEKMIKNTSEAICKLVKDKELRENMGRNSREYAKKNFIMSEKIKKIDDYYKEILKCK